MSTAKVHKKINEKHKDTDDRRQTASLQNTNEHKTISHKILAKKKNLATRWTSVLVCILSAPLPRFVRVTSALRRKLDRIKNNLYNAIQAPRSRVAAVLRRLHMRSKGFSQSVFLSSINAFKYARSTVMKTFHNFFHGRPLMAVFATTILAAAILAGCGSGGSGDTPVSPPPPTTPTPVNAVVTTTVTPADGATGVARDMKLTAVFESNTFVASSTASLSCAGISQTLNAAPPVVSGKTTTVTWAAASPLPYGATCTYQVLATAPGVDGGTQVNVNQRGTITVEQLVCKTGESVSPDGQTCVAVASWWPPKSITPMGVKVLSSTLAQLPAGCLSFTAECFKNFVAESKMVTLNTTATMTGLPAPDNRPLVTLVYLTPSGKMQITLFFADNGAVAVQQVIDFNIGNPFEWVIGNERGYIMKDNVLGTCLQWKWNYNPTTGKGLFWDYEGATCPQ